MARIRGPRNSIDVYGTAMERLAEMTSRNAQLQPGHRAPHGRPPDGSTGSRVERPSPVAPEPAEPRPSPTRTPRSPQHSRRTRTSAAGRASISQPGPIAPAVNATINGLGTAAPAVRRSALRTSSALVPPGPPPRKLPLVVDQMARIVGIEERSQRRDPSVEANARLTGATGLVLAVLFVLEGLTIPLIFPLLSWHIAIGLAIVPPLLVKMGSTLWRFGRYYLGDPRFQRAGPPHPLLRILGPVLMGSTVALIVSGIALWLAGPRSDLFLLRVHQASFVLWFACIAVHFLSHFLRAVRLAAADSRDAQASHPALRGAHLRRGLVAVSLVVGIGLGVVSHGVATGWSHLTPARPVQRTPTDHPPTHSTTGSTPQG